MAVLPEERRIAILDLVSRAAVVRADDLAERFGVSVETIRRDLATLEQAGLTRRVYGGATRTMPRPSEPPFEQRRRARAAQKRAMGRAAAALVEPGDMLLLDVGTSVAEVASHLPSGFHGRVVTNSVLAAIELADRPGVDVLVSGGRLRAGDLACSGPAARSFFEGFFGGTAFLGSGGVDLAAGLTDFHPDEVPIRQVMIERAQEQYVMADSSKLDQVAPIRVCALDRVTAIITDDGIDERTARRFGEAGIRLIVAEVEPRELEAGVRAEAGA